MRVKYLKILGLLIAFFAVSSFLTGCGAKTSPAGPAPVPLEIPAPAVLKFVSYQGLQVDLAAISGAPLVSGNTAAKTVVDPADPAIFPDGILDQIQLGPDLHNTFTDNFFSYVLNGIQELNIPVDQLNVGCKETKTFSVSTGFLAGPDQKVVLDFRAFDYNNDGSVDDENCSGNTTFSDATETILKSVCVRFWLGGAPFIAGVFDYPPVYPSASAVIPDALGKGRFKIFVPQLDVYEFLTAYQYEQPEGVVQKGIEFFFVLRRGAGFSGGEELLFNDFVGHSALAQVGPNNEAFKSFKLNTDVKDFGNPYGGLARFGDFSINYIGQFVDGVDLWGGAIDWWADILTWIFPDGRMEFTDACAVASTGIVVDKTQCQDVLDPASNHFNLLSGDPAPFIAQIQESDVTMPAGFLGSSPTPGLPECETYR